MKNQTLLIIAGLAAAGGIGFVLWRSRNQNQLPIIAGPTGQVAGVNPQLLTQPSQVYPSQYGSGQVQRQDTASQPWYGGTRAPLSVQPNVDQNFIQNVQYAKGAADIISSVSSIWDDLNLGSLWQDDGAYFSEDDSSEMSWDWGNIA